MSWKAKRFNGQHNKPYREATSSHHRKPRSQGGNGDDRNLSDLPRSRHAAWHTLFQNWIPERIADEINRRYLDPDYELVVVRRST
jgi:hypothetical protein